ncbi:MAG: FIG003003: hypothetical protein [uncultured Sphingosinicella sp.]|uniref:DUF72 domain-containing protein n=1 Tax=uncultured Sphingosinicella sp. TaxID=478748 RepID=A0A6J4TJ29_9SPHN|nr:DUF72 domain-containing protein [uncultured Sphingosinicella sp.]CAA9523773.1 MAG: FIG003003: hypothetical protein [uncultured Sphingosinicella sp.]
MEKIGTIRIGCSGWNYKHWREAFYPKGLPVKRWFEHYVATFSTVELNTSFYRLPKPETFDKWREQAPPGFTYAVKAPRFITHMKKLKECHEPVDEFLGRARRLGHTVGPLLYQLPPRWAFNRERMEEFLALLPPDLVHVFEFREKSWLTEDVLELLDGQGISFCAHDMPGSATPRWASGPIAYVRFHGTEGKYWGRYSDEGLLGWTDWIVEQSLSGRDVWCYFNNDIHAHAIDDALTLRSMVAQAAR